MEKNGEQIEKFIKRSEIGPFVNTELRNPKFPKLNYDFYDAINQTRLMQFVIYINN